MKKFILLIITAILMVGCYSSYQLNIDPIEVKIPTKYEVAKEFCDKQDLYTWERDAVMEAYMPYEYSECKTIVDSLSAIDWGKWYSINNIKKWDSTIGYGSDMYEVKNCIENYRDYLKSHNQYNSHIDTLAYRAEWLSDTILEKRDSVMQKKYPKEWKRHQDNIASVNAYIEATKEAYLELYREQKEHRYEKPKKYKESISYTPYGTIVTLTEK